MSKIAISLPEEMLQAVEKERLAKRETRSQFFRRAVEQLLRRERERQWDEQYVRAYQLYPETPEELAWAQLGLAELAQEPWEDGDPQ